MLNLLNEIQGIPIYDNDFEKLIFRFAVTLLVSVILIRFIYYPKQNRKDYLFTFFLMSIITFFICFTLKKFDLDTGMALGLFAIFGIIRYRTDPIPIKEMTYIFIIIGISVINALANKKTSYAELLFANGIIIAITFGLEYLWLIRHEAVKTVIYERIDLIVPEKHDEFMADLQERTGLIISRTEIGKIDFLRDVATIKVYYYEDKQGSKNYEDTSADD
jgi:hypothetical protein